MDLTTNELELISLIIRDNAKEKKWQQTGIMSSHSRVHSELVVYTMNLLADRVDLQIK